MSRTPGTDRVFLRNIQLTLTVGFDCWHRPKPQPVLLSVFMLTDVGPAAEGDDIALTINYGAVCKALVDSLSKLSYTTLARFASEAGSICLRVGGCTAVEVVAHLPKALLQAESIDGGITVRLEVKKMGEDQLTSLPTLVMKTRLSCVIGVHPHERAAKQPIVLSLTSRSYNLWEIDDFQKWFSKLFDVSSLDLSSRLWHYLLWHTRKLKNHPIEPWRP
jgi:dihydroneopterin aldolase/2-amino-4-hydroxy-6-hydroxymethyldihydropteridine diphosphokinase/dihydropteroate synthase